jgi:hypothetical protein
MCFPNEPLVDVKQGDRQRHWAELLANSIVSQSELLNARLENKCTSIRISEDFQVLSLRVRPNQH